MWRVVRSFLFWMFGLTEARVARTTLRPKLSEIEFARILAVVVDGVTEFRLPDDSRVDILTDTHAVEVDWAHKWPEGIGQALYYGLVTGRQSTVLLLADIRTDSRFINRCHTVCERYHICLWVYDWPNGKLMRDGKTTEVR